MSTDPRTAPHPADYFAADHRACDERWAEVEAAAEAGDAARVAAAYATFAAALRRHLEMEEHVLFPALEEATGMRQGPTAVMRHEHQQMRGVLDQMAQAVAATDTDGLLDHGDTLLMLTQQHNMKEEGILYPLADRALGGAWPALAEKLARY